MTDIRNVIVIGSGPAGLHRRAVRGPCQPRAARAQRAERRRPADAHDRRRELPRLRRRHPRPRADGADGEAGRAVRRARSSPRARHARRPLEPPVRGLGRRPGVASEDRSSSRPAPARVAGHPRRGEAPWARRERLRHVRRILLPGPRAGRGGRRRHRDGGGHVPHEVREQGVDRASSRRVPGLADHGRPRPREPQDRGDLGHGGRRDPRRRRGHGRPLHDGQTGERRDVATDGVFMAIGHTPNTALFEGQLELDEADTSSWTSPGRARTSRASSPPETSPTRSTGRPSPPPGKGARLRSTRSACWKRRRTPPPDTGNPPSRERVEERDGHARDQDAGVVHLERSTTRWQTSAA